MSTPEVLTRPWPGLDVSDLTILVAGFGVSGYAVADQTRQRRANVIVVDAADSPLHREQAQVLQVLGVDVRLGPEHTLALPAGERVDLVVTSPGWRPDQPLLVEAQQAGIPVWSEVELARRMQSADGPAWLGVTGTNGKTTVVTMLETILRGAGLRAVACGNVGLPVIEAALDPSGYDVLAVELSSFQLHRTEHAACEAAVVLGIREDHLDWHGSLEAYARDKGSIFTLCEVACVYPVADERARRLVEDADVVEGARAIGLTLGPPGVSELGIVDGVLVDRAFLTERQTRALELASLEDLAHLGPHGAPPHLVFDALAAAALARAHGVQPAFVRAGLRAYRPGRHRSEVVAEADAITYVDDSKATNPDAAAASLGAFEHLVWIAGGLTKGADLDALVADAAGRLRAVVLIGVDQTPFLHALARHAAQVPVVRIPPSGTDTEDGRRAHMQRTVDAAASLAQPGDVVLLAPAAASMDQFTDYAERGTLFGEAAQHRAGGTA